MNIRHTPGTVAAPFGPYSHAVEVPADSRLLYISGEVRTARWHRAARHRGPGRSLCWRNIKAILADPAWASAIW